MPLSPSTWQTFTPITAHQLNQDLYSYDGSYFGANGVLFHSNRPLLVETYTTKQVVSAPKGGKFTILGGTVSSGISVVDNAALFGVGADKPGDSARFRSAGAVSPGSAGIAGVQGGWNLIFNFVPVSPFSQTSGSAFGSAWFLGTTAQQDIGPVQPGSAVYDNCGFAVDLVLRTPGDGGLTVGAWMTDGAGRNGTVMSNQTSTCGETPRLGEVWCGVLSGNNLLVKTIPSPIPSIGAATTLSSGTLNTSIQQTLALLNYPPMLSIQAPLGGILGTSLTTLNWLANTPVIDNFSAFSVSTNYVVPTSGMYFCHCTAVLEHGGVAGQFATGFNVNGTNYYGGWYTYGPANNQYFGAAATKLLDLNAGDTISTFIQSSTGGQILSAVSSSHWNMVWMGAITGSGLTWTPPEVTGFQFQAATQPGTAATQLAGIMNSKIANDLNFLLNRPYLTVYQSTAQTGLAVNSFVPITMQTAAGLVHGSTGDNYGGWSAVNNRYTAQVSGWYLAIEEIAIAANAGAQDQITAGFSVPTSGGFASPATSHGQPDRYQSMPHVSGGTNPAGVTAIGCYYLAKGETIAPAAMFQSGTRATFSTDVTHNFNSHFELLWLSN